MVREGLGRRGRSKEGVGWSMLGYGRRGVGMGVGGVEKGMALGWVGEGKGWG